MTLPPSPAPVRHELHVLHALERVCASAVTGHMQILAEYLATKFTEAAEAMAMPSPAASVAETEKNETEDDQGSGGNTKVPGLRHGGVVGLSSSDDQIRADAITFIEAQLAIMERFGSRPVLSAERYERLVQDVMRPALALARERSRGRRSAG